MHIGKMMTLPISGGDDETTVVAKMPRLCSCEVEPVGRWFEAYCVRRHHKQTLSYHSLNSSSSEDDGDDLSEDDEDDQHLLRTLDPRDWKNQDHYAVLGLLKLRFKATEDQIKRAYKKKVLKHHPDKRRARGEVVKEGDDDYFTCVTRAYENLGIPVKRRSYDSVDPMFDDNVPSANNESKENFHKIFAPVFEANARWSKTRKPAPELGSNDASYQDVNNFYSYWYDFDSWREFSYLDEEEKEKGENREERKWIEKQNRAARQKRKKEEVTRVRELVDNAYNCDPRIARFKEEERAKKLAQKQAKKDAARQKAEEEDRIKQEALEEERKKKEKEDEEAKAQAAVLKKENEARKKVLKRERKTLRTKLKEYDYFTADEDEKVTYMQEVEKLIETLSLDSLQSFNEDLTSGDEGRAKESFLNKVKEMNEQLEAEKQRHLEGSQKHSSSSDAGVGKTAWPEEELQLLIKAVKVYPAGTVERWEVIATFIKHHMPSSNRTAKEVLFKAKELQRMDPIMKEQVNKKAYDRFEKEHKSTVSDKADVSKRFDTVAEQQIGETGSNPAPWTAEEQKILEQSLRTYPASTDQRWEKIAAMLPARSKKDCMKRYKELVEMVRAKKAAAAKK